MPAPRALLLSLLLSGLTARWADGQGMHQPHASVWPHPKILTRGHGSSRSVVSALRLVNAGPPNDIVDKALSRYHDYLFSEDTGGLSEWQWGPTPGAPPRNCSAAAGGTNVGNAGPPLNQLTVTVTNSSTIFGMDGDESYVLDVPVTGDATLTASTPVGAVRGLESFYQLCILRRKQCTYRIPAVPIHVEDAPRWTHRGLLVDTGRDFMSVSKLKAVIEALSWNKMSVLHCAPTQPDPSSAPAAVWVAHHSHTFESSLIRFNALPVAVRVAHQGTSLRLTAFPWNSTASQSSPRSPSPRSRSTPKLTCGASSSGAASAVSGYDCLPAV